MVNSLSHPQCIRRKKTLASFLPLHFLLGVQIHILIHGHPLQLASILAQLEQLLDPRGWKMRFEMTFVFLQDLRLRLITAELVAKGSLDDGFLKNSAVVQGDGQGVRDRAGVGVVVGFGEEWILDAGDAASERLYQGRGRRFAAIGVVGGFQAVEHQHRGHHVLNAVVAVGEVVHRLVLLVDDADAGFMGAADDGLDVRGRFAEVLQLLVDDFGGFNCGLRMEFG